MPPIARAFELRAPAHIRMLAIRLRIRRTRVRQLKPVKNARSEDVSYLFVGMSFRRRVTQECMCESLPSPYPCAA